MCRFNSPSAEGTETGGSLGLSSQPPEPNWVPDQWETRKAMWHLLKNGTSVDFCLSSCVLSGTCIHYIITIPYTQTYTVLPKAFVTGWDGPWFLSSSVVFLSFSSFALQNRSHDGKHFQEEQVLCNEGEPYLGALWLSHNLWVFSMSLFLLLLFLLLFWACFLTVCGFHYRCQLLPG